MERGELGTSLGDVMVEQDGGTSGGRLRTLAERIKLLVLCGLLVLLVKPLQAQDAAGIDARIQQLQSQLDELKAWQAQETSAQASRIVPAAAVTEAWSMDARHGTSPCLHCQSTAGPCCSTKDKYPTAKLTGFFQTDVGWFHQDRANMLAVGDIQDGADFRRARLAAVGNAWENVSYMLEMDFAFPGRPSFMDVWLQVEDVVGGDVRIGQFRTPFGMAGQTSVKELLFLERALPFAFLPFRQIGAMYHTTLADETMTWAASIFRFPTDAYGGNVGDDGGYSMATRLTGLLIDNGDAGVLHLGGGYSFIEPSNNLVQYRNQPEFFVAETGGAALVPIGVPSNVPPFVNTGLIPTGHVNLWNGELGATLGSLYGQSEIFLAQVDSLVGPSLSFSGAYAHVGYVLTGETRPYNRSNGVFGRVVPRYPFGTHGLGAWEIAARWSYIDLNDNFVQGGRLTDMTFGLNWYLNRNTKFQFNYIHAFLASSPEVYGPVIRDSDADILAIRAQVDF